ncbi:MAG: cysA [Nevskia sp.]|nr:cysA [Nevskia sp.]
MNITIRDVHKHYGGFHALRGIDLDIASGELLALLGPSGSGKTTLLRAIAGLEPLAQGRILFGDTDATALSVQQRKVGFVFQQYALFKHMTVADNIAFGLKVRARKLRPNDAAIKQRVDELLELVQLDGLDRRYPAQLSGGQKQRVALARALAIEPRVLLLDEPFGALDAKVRKDLRRWLRKLHRETGYTTIFVTHDQEEALELADRVVVMNKGQIEQVGTTDEVYDFPKTPFVFDFLGTPNVLPGIVRDGRVYLDGSTQPIDSGAHYPSGLVDIYARPNDFRVVDANVPGLDAQVLETQRTGQRIRLTLSINSGETLEIDLPHLDAELKVWQTGETIRVRPANFSVFARTGAKHSSAPDPLPDESIPGSGISHTVAEHRARGRN